MKKFIIIGLAIFIGLIVIALIYLNNVYVPKHLKPLVIELLEKNLGKKVSIGKAFYFPLKGVLFSKVDIKNQDLTPFLEIDKVDLGLKSLPRVNKNEISIRARLIIEGVTFKQQKLEVNGGSILDINLQIKGKNDINFSGAITLNNLGIKGIEPIADISKIHGEIICTGDSFYSKGLSAKIGKQTLDILIEGKYDKANLFLNKFIASCANTNFSGKGKLSDFENLEFEASGTGKFDLKDTALITSGITLPALSGECLFSLKGQGLLADLKTIQAQANLELKQGAVDKIKFSQAKAEIELKNGVIKLAPLNSVFYEGKISAAAKATIISEDIPVQCSVDIEGVNFEPLVKDVIEQDMGSGFLDAHVGMSGPMADLNVITGSGWFKVNEGQIRMPPNFEKVANSLGAGRLAEMKIKEATATFSISDGRIQTQDLLMVADEATISGKGYIDLEQYVEFEALFNLTPEFVQSTGGAQGLLKFVSNEDGTPLAKVKVYDRISQLKYKIIPLPVQDIIKSKAKNELQETIKNIFSPEDGSEQPENGDIQEQIKKGLKGLFE